MKGAIAMNKVLLVEGDVDDAFFNSIFGKWETVADIEVAIGGGVPNIFEKLKTLVRIGIRQLGIALDINDKDEEHVYKKVFDILVNEFGVDSIEKISQNEMHVKNTYLVIIPAGIKEEPLLQEFGIKKHVIEDYVIRILKEDDNLAKTLSKGKLKSNDLIECLRKTIDSLTPDCIELISSKQLLDLTKAIIGFRASPAVFTKEVIDNSNSEILEGVIKDLKRILQNW